MPHIIDNDDKQHIYFIMSNDWGSLSRKEKKDAAQSTLEMLEQKKKTTQDWISIYEKYIKRQPHSPAFVGLFYLSGIQ